MNDRGIILTDQDAADIAVVCLMRVSIIEARIMTCKNRSDLLELIDEKYRYLTLYKKFTYGG